MTGAASDPAEDASGAPIGLCDAATMKLFAWLSPGYPVGAFSYSHGIETAIAAGEIVDGASLAERVETILRFGAGRTDAILLAQAHARPEDEEIAALAAALAPSKERRLETLAQGRAFAETTGAAWDPTLAHKGAEGAAPPREIAYTIALGRAAARHGVAVEHVAPLHLQAMAANLISVGVRLIPLGQTEGQRILAGLGATVRSTAEEALRAGLDDIGGCAFRADLASLAHETLPVRLFRS